MAQTKAAHAEFVPAVEASFIPERIVWGTESSTRGLAASG
jgi:hypothetical protein